MLRGRPANTSARGAEHRQTWKSIVLPSAVLCGFVFLLAIALPDGARAARPPSPTRSHLVGALSRRFFDALPFHVSVYFYVQGGLRMYMHGTAATCFLSSAQRCLLYKGFVTRRMQCAGCHANLLF